jgi:dihydroxyacetone kinase
MGQLRPIFTTLQQNREVGMVIVGEEGSYYETVKMAENWD